nr:xaa-Pro dipeptidase-like [Onthophagus taurus]
MSLIKKNSPIFNPSKPGYLWMGEGTLAISLQLYAENRRRLVEKLQEKNLGNAIVVLQGGDEIQMYDTNGYYLFRQESYFTWAFGVVEPAFFGTIEVQTGKSTLFIPRLPESYEAWYGPIWTPEDFMQKYQVDQVYYTDEIATILAQHSPSQLLILRGFNQNSGSPTLEATFDGIENFIVNGTDLFDDITYLRVIKTDLEIEVMRYAIETSCEGHLETMKMALPGTSEYQSESEFLHYCYSKRGCRHTGYISICGSGPNGAILHYGHAGAPNDRWIEDGDICVYDMGAAYFGYTADITTSFPANGKFTDDQKLIYQAVLNANRAAIKETKPGVRFSVLSAASNRALMEGLKSAGIVTGDIDEMLAANLPYYFQPHGLGHLLGLDVHDVGGYFSSFKNPNEAPRFNRPLEKGIVFTIEPGCYFIDFLLNEALGIPNLSRFLVPSVLNRFRGSGGVRIEDDVVVTDDGCENLSAMLPRTIDEIEAWFAANRSRKN